MVSHPDQYISVDLRLTQTTKKLNTIYGFQYLQVGLSVLYLSALQEFHYPTRARILNRRIGWKTVTVLLQFLILWRNYLVLRSLDFLYRLHKGLTLVCVSYQIRPARALYYFFLRYILILSIYFPHDFVVKIILQLLLTLP